MTRATNAGIGVTRYLQVYTVISQALAEGDIGAGEALPSEPSLVREYGVSRTTVRRALARLAKEGYIVRRRGSGTFARDRVTKSASAREYAAILDDPRRVATNTTTRVLEFKNTPTPDFLHREWPEFGATVLAVRKVQSVDHQPVALVNACIPEEIGRQLTERRLGNDTILVALDKIGFHGATVEEEASAAAADPVAARHLEYGVGFPVLNVKRVARDARGRALCYTNSLYRADRYEIHTIVERERNSRARQAFRL